jgi:hypothetical protein
MLPPCFRPTAECRAILERVDDNDLSLTDDELARYEQVGFVARTPVIDLSNGESVMIPYLTDLGREALNR